MAKILTTKSTVVDKKWRDIRVGDVVRIESDDFILANMIILMVGISLLNRPIPQMGVLALLGDSPEEAPLIAQLPARHGGCAICH